MPLADLPSEILCNVYSHCDYEDAARLSQTCLRLGDICSLCFPIMRGPYAEDLAKAQCRVEGDESLGSLRLKLGKNAEGKYTD